MSFDITDRSIKIIEGVEKNGKVKVYMFSTISIEEGIIENGIVKKTSELAQIINRELESKKMKRKEAVISISSNLATFKEISVPKVKNGQLRAMVKSKLQQEINIYEEQSVGYTIIPDNEENNKMTKVLVTSCPKLLVESYKIVFSMLKISLKDMSVSCNCISNIITRDKNYIKMMPLLLVEVDPEYININIFENGHLSFSRFATISPDDYDDKNDYMFQAVNENIFRLIQFQDMRRKKFISNVVFYGDTTLYERLQEHLKQLGLESSLLSINNSTIHINFANAMGAIVNANKSEDSTNLLDDGIDSAKQIQVSMASVGLHIGLSILAGVIILIGIVVGMNIYNKNINKKIESVNKYMNSPITIKSKNEAVNLKSENEKMNDYYIELSTITDYINSQPVIRSEVFDQVHSAFNGANYNFVSLTYNNGLVTEKFIVDNQTIPSSMVIKMLNDKNNIDFVNYTGYSLAEGKGYMVNLTFGLKGEIELEKKTKLLNTYKTDDNEEKHNDTKEGDK